MEAPTLWERCYLPICCMVFMLRLRIGEVNRSDRPAAYANGAFMLIRRHVYETLGGHGKVRNELNDDIALGRMAKRDGFQLRLAGNGGLYRTRMYGSVRRAWDGWTRNFCGTLGSTRELLAALAITVALFIVPWAGLVASLIGASSPVSSPSTTSSVLSAAVPIAWGLAVIVSQLGMWAAYPFFGSSAWHSLLFPPGAVFVAAIVARATIRSFRRSGTSWHGAHYGPRPRGQ
jgi:ABC-type multidrug transport system fused ATPase/permease subunit